MATRLQFDFPAASGADFRGGSSRALSIGTAARIRAAVARWKERRMLLELDERVLRDIGISRSQALAEASKPFWRP